MFGGGGIGQYQWGDFKADTKNPYFDNTILHNDTLVILMFDNGSNRPLGLQNGTEVPAYNAGMRGGKKSPFEGGIRVPFFLYWKDVLPEDTDIPALTRHIDIYPTLCRLAGAELPDGELKPDGRSLVPLLEDSQADWPERKLFFHSGRWGQGRTSLATREESKYNGAAVRTPRWRLVFEVVDGQTVTTLSDIRIDPGETTNMADHYPDVVAALKSDFDRWWDHTEPYLINEGMPNIHPEKQPLTLLYEKQLEENGVIPEWAPGAL